MSSSSDDLNIKLELYKVATEMADRMSARRSAANTFFFTINAALATIVGVVSSARAMPSRGSLPTFDPFGLVVTAAAGLVLSVAWWSLLRYYRRLSSAKYKVINEIEGAFPMQPYTQEWSLLHPSETLKTDSLETAKAGFWKRTQHREATVIEQVVPFAFAAIYVILAIRVTLR